MSEIRSHSGSDGLSEAVVRECLRAFPHIRLTVTGDCMRPDLEPGDTVLLASSTQRPLRLGDVVLARHPQGLRLHRLVWGSSLSTSNGKWRTKADRGTLLDPAVSNRDILGTMVGVEGGRRHRRPPVWAALVSLAGWARARLRQKLPGGVRA